MASDSNRPVRIWLLTGCFLIAAMVTIGGITRLTGSGLSITEWDVVTGALPPLSEAHWRELFGFSKWLLLNNIFNFIDSQLDVFIIGRIFGAHSLGLYKVAAEISSLPSTELVAPIQRAIFPGFAKLAHDHKALCKSYIDGIGILVMLAQELAKG